MRKNLVRIKLAAEILKRSVATLRHWDKAGKLRAYRAKNGYRLYRISELEKFAEKHRIRRGQNTRWRLVG